MIHPSGYFKIWRELFSKPIWINSTPEQNRILITLLAMANYKGNKWDYGGKQFELEPGQFVTSLDSIQEECGKCVSIRNIRTALERFENLGFLTNKSTNRFRIITIVNWALYQSDDECSDKQNDKLLTSYRQATDKLLTTKEESKESNKEKNTISNVEINKFFESVWSIYPRKEGKASVSLSQKKILYDLGFETISKCIERYKQAKVKTDPKYLQMGSTFFNSGYFDYLDKNYVQQSTIEEMSGVIKTEGGIQFT